MKKITKPNAVKRGQGIQASRRHTRRAPLTVWEPLQQLPLLSHFLKHLFGARAVRTVVQVRELPVQHEVLARRRAKQALTRQPLRGRTSITLAVAKSGTQNGRSGGEKSERSRHVLIA